MSGPREGQMLSVRQQRALCFAPAGAINCGSQGCSSRWGDRRILKPIRWARPDLIVHQH